MDTSNHNNNTSSELFDADSDVVMVPLEQDNPNEFPDDEFAVATAAMNTRRTMSASMVVGEEDDDDSTPASFLSRSLPTGMSPFFGYRRPGTGHVVPTDEAATANVDQGDMFFDTEDRSPTTEEAAPMVNDKEDEEANLILEAASPPIDNVEISATAPVTEVQIPEARKNSWEEDDGDDMSTLASEQQLILPAVGPRRGGEEDKGASPTTLSLKIDDVVSTVSENLWKVVEDDKDTDTKKENDSDHKVDNHRPLSTTASGTGQSRASIPKSEATATQEPVVIPSDEEASESKQQIKDKKKGPLGFETLEEQQAASWDLNAFVAVGETLLQPTPAASTSPDKEAQEELVASEQVTPSAQGGNTKSWSKIAAVVFIALAVLGAAAFKWISATSGPMVWQKTAMNKASDEATLPTLDSPSETFLEDGPPVELAADGKKAAVDTAPEMVEVILNLYGDNDEHTANNSTLSPYVIEEPMAPFVAPSALLVQDLSEPVEHPFPLDGAYLLHQSEQVQPTPRFVGSFISFCILVSAISCVVVAGLTVYPRWIPVQPKVLVKGEAGPILGEDPPSIDTKSYDSRTRDYLKEKLRHRKYPVGGTKGELIDRLVKSYYEEYKGMDREQLQLLLKGKTLKQNGKKEDLIVRLLEAGC